MIEHEHREAGVAPPFEVTEFEELAEAMRRRAERARRLAAPLIVRLERALPSDARSELREIAGLMADVFAELDAAGHELECQNDALFEARVLAEDGARGWVEQFERAPALALRTDAYGVIERVNDAACQLLRRPANALSGKPLAVFIAPEERPRFRAALWRSVASRAIESWPIRLVPSGATSAISCRARTRALGDSRGITRGLLWYIVEDDPAEDLF